MVLIIPTVPNHINLPLQLQYGVTGQNLGAPIITALPWNV
jgi:hypothetical protein